MTERPTYPATPADSPDAPRWEQPAFVTGEPEPAVTGTVLAWGVDPRGPAFSPLTQFGPVTPEEQRLATLRRLLWPMALVIAIVTGHWVPVLVLLLVVNGVLRRQLFELRRRRLVAVAAGAPTDLR